MIKSLPKLMVLTEKNVRRNTILQIIIATLAFVLLVGIWPMGLVREHSVSKQQALWERQYAENAMFQVPDKKLQGVRFANEHIYQITLYMSCLTYDKDDYVIFRLYDDRFSCIYEENVVCNLIMRENAMVVTPDMEVEPGRDYFYEILIPTETLETRHTEQKLILPVADKVLLEQEENQILYIDGIYNDKEALIADFDYTSALPVWKVVLAGVFVVLFSLATYLGAIFVLERCAGYVISNGKQIRLMAMIFVSVLIGIVFVLVVIKNIFGGFPMDRVIYGIGLVTALAWILCAIRYIGKKRLALELPVAKQVSLMWRNYLQTVFIGFAVHSACLYVNADREYVHVTNTRWLLIFMGLAFLMIYSEKRLCNVFSYVWLGLSGIGALAYYYIFAKGDAEELYVVKLTIAVIIVWGLLLINVFLSLKKTFWKQISKPFFGLWCVFATLMIYWRADKNWIFTATLPFVVILLYNLSAVAKVRLLNSIANGICVSFVLYLLFSMHHRPYNAWLLFRYGGMFHTVACTGMYLALVVAVALGKLFAKWKKPGNLLARGWKELGLLGVSTGCIMLTMSRTAMLTIIVNFIIVFVLAAFIYRKSIKQLIFEVGLVAVTLILCFAMTFSATRMIPALINEPVYYSLEEQYIAYNVQKGDAINDGEKYMSFDRYMAVLLGRFQIASEQTVEYSEQSANNVVDYTENNDSTTTQDKETESYVVETDADVTNGRLDIYLGYLNALEMQGHEKMALPREDGKEYVHAHNSYLQVAYDFGIPAGIVFLLLCAFTLWRSIYFVYKYGQRYSVYMVPVSVIVSFGFISVTEWAFHPCIPIGFVFLLMQMLLMGEPEGKESSVRVS